MPDFLASGSLALIFAAFVGAGVGVPISEDAVILATGALSATGSFAPLSALLVCYFGVLSGDLLLFTIGRQLGPRMLRMRFFQRVLPEARLQRTEAMFARRGPLAIFISRFLIGFRVPGFATAGLLRMPLWQFLLFDALGAAITVPLEFYLGYTFANRIDEIQALFGDIAGWVAVGVVALLLVGALVWWRKRKHNEDGAT